MKILENEVATFQLASRTRALETLQIEESIRMNLPKELLIYFLSEILADQNIRDFKVISSNVHKFFLWIFRSTVNNWKGELIQYRYS